MNIKRHFNISELDSVQQFLLEVPKPTPNHRKTPHLGWNDIGWKLNSITLITNPSKEIVKFVSKSEVYCKKPPILSVTEHFIVSKQQRMESHYHYKQTTKKYGNSSGSFITLDGTLQSRNVKPMKAFFSKISLAF